MTDKDARANHGHGNEKDHGNREALPPGIARAPHEKGGGYLYRESRLVCRADDVDAVQEGLARYVRERAPRRGDKIEVARLEYRPVEGSAYGETVLSQPALASVDVPDVIPHLRDAETNGAGRALDVYPQHVLVSSSHPDPFCVIRPFPAKAKILPAAQVSTADRDVVVAIVDSGVFAKHPLLDGRVDFRPTDEETPPTDGTDLPEFTGHGTFVAGIVRQHAPAAKICVRKVFGGDGLFTDEAFAQGLRALPENVDIVTIASGGPAHAGVGGDALPFTREALNELFRRNPNIVVVAAAGNDGIDVPYYPAAYKDVIGVAAVDEAGKRPCFSNYGPWVDACARGSNVLSSFFDFGGRVQNIGPKPCCPQPSKPIAASEIRTFAGWAHWSGTSFAAPQVAGAIAAKMMEMGTKSAVDAANALLSGQPMHVGGDECHIGVLVDPPALAFA